MQCQHCPPSSRVLQPCVKLAWDCYVWEHMAAYAQQAHLIGAQVMGINNANDYMAVAVAAAVMLLDVRRR